MKQRSIVLVHDNGVKDASSFVRLQLRLLRCILLAAAMFLVGISSSAAEIISAHSEAAGDLLLSLMRQSPIKDPEAKWARRDICQSKATVNRVYYDTNILSTCMLGRTQKATTGEPSRLEKPSSEKKASPEKKVNVDPDPDWANATRDRILKGKQGDVVAVNENPNRVAPYGSADCAEIKPAPNRGAIDWDSVIIRNKCSYPIKVLTCYYDQGRRADCVTKKGAKGWGQSDLLDPGETQDSVATSKKLPWFARIVVCDMREKKNLLCVLPD